MMDDLEIEAFTDAHPESICALTSNAEFQRLRNECLSCADDEWDGLRARAMIYGQNFLQRRCWPEEAAFEAVWVEDAGIAWRRAYGDEAV
jgi:hypothetical protein